MKYIVSVTRIGYGCLDLQVEAKSADEAKEIALNLLCDNEIDISHCNFRAGQVVCVTSARRRELVVKLLDDEYGISEDAYDAMMEVGMIPDDIANRVKATEGRFYLPDCI